MGQTLDEWVDANAKDLRDNLRANINVFCEGWDEETREGLLRMHLLMVRQWSEASRPRKGGS